MSIMCTGKLPNSVVVSHTSDHRCRVGDWIPSDHRAQREWLRNVIEHVDKNPKELHPVVAEFKHLIESDTRIFLLVQSMFEQIPNKKPYNADPPAEHKQVRDYQHMLELLSHLLTSAPRWSDASRKAGMVGLPINAALDWPMGTPSGFAFFLDPAVNKIFKKLINAWGVFLVSQESAEQALGDDSAGWFNPSNKAQLTATANAASFSSKQADFETLFHCDPGKPHHGYTSWDHFFTRTFRFEDGIRPVASPQDDNVVANACESKPYNVARNARLRDRFWIKGQPYSVRDMLGHDALAEHFDGATVYQAFLSALSYHRWHAPVSGTIVKAFVKDGTYYSEPLLEGLGDPQHAANGTIDESGETTAQGYLTAVATRAVVFIQADNPAIGLMAFIGVGMAEVSTCDITVAQGQRVRKGDQIGMFHFGGSTHCLLFREGVDVQGFPQPGPEHNVAVRSQLAVVEG
jgi:phosphatidylserine decarboxylase